METFDSLWKYCTQENRVIPNPQVWNKMYGMLNDKVQKPTGGWEPPLPLILAAWHHTMPIEKQLRFKEHIQWAADHQQLEEIAAYLKSLDESEWYHFGEL